MAAFDLGEQAVALSQWVARQTDSAVPLVPTTVQFAGRTHWGLQIQGMRGQPNQMVFIDGRPRHPDEEGASFLHRVEHRVRTQLRLGPHRTATFPSFSEALPV